MADTLTNARGSKEVAVYDFAAAAERCPQEPDAGVEARADAIKAALVVGQADLYEPWETENRELKLRIAELQRINAAFMAAKPPRYDFEISMLQRSVEDVQGRIEDIQRVLQRTIDAAKRGKALATKKPNTKPAKRRAKK